MSPPANLASTFVVIRPDLGAESIAVTNTIYSELDDRYSGFKGHILISSHQFSDNWPTWEIHPHGDEVVYLLSGDVEFLLRTEGGDERVRLDTPGSFVVVPKGTWHTAHVNKPTQMVFVTPGEGTENRESPPE